MVVAFSRSVVAISDPVLRCVGWSRVKSRGSNHVRFFNFI